MSSYSPLPPSRWVCFLRWGIKLQLYRIISGLQTVPGPLYLVLGSCGQTGQWTGELANVGPQPRYSLQSPPAPPPVYDAKKNMNIHVVWCWRGCSGGASTSHCYFLLLKWCRAVTPSNPATQHSGHTTAIFPTRQLSVAFIWCTLAPSILGIIISTASL